MATANGNTADPQPSSGSIVRIIWATYGPCPGRRLFNGEITNDKSSIPYTRDVLPHLSELLERSPTTSSTASCDATARRGKSCRDSSTNNSASLINAAAGSYSDSDSDAYSDLHRRRVAIPVMDGKAMNAVFGDPCPGTTKMLSVKFVFRDEQPTKGGTMHNICRAIFREHERVVLRRSKLFYQDDSRLERFVKSGGGSKRDSTESEEKKTSGEGRMDTDDIHNDDQHQDGGGSPSDSALDYDTVIDDTTDELRTLQQMGRSQSISEMADAYVAARPMPEELPAIKEGLQCMFKLWRLRSATSEIVLPLLLPYLEVRQRALSRLVCKCWRFVVRSQGVATTVDVNDPSFPRFTRSFFRGIISQSYSSLNSLILNDFTALTKEDLHPAIPHLRKLRTLDISRCAQLDDSTLVLVSESLVDTLEILYMKGLQHATDEGLIAVCKSCRGIRVLEISNVPITDKAAVSIGDNLTKLEALYMRDNFRLTNVSIDCITAKCKELSLLTLWGCYQLRNLAIRSKTDPSSVAVDNNESKITLLNLWGCHSILDETAASIGRMPHLRSLIVSECHNLTDRFVISLSQSVTQIQHLHLRYTRRITDDSIMSIANSMSSIQSLDLSFCTRVTTASLAYLLENAPSLTELRLLSCFQIDVTVRRADSDSDVQPLRDGARPAANGGAAGRLLLAAIRSRSVDKSKLLILDMRGCIGRHRHHNNVRQQDNAFIQGMEGLGFHQCLELFFSRPATFYRGRVGS